MRTYILAALATGTALVANPAMAQDTGNFTGPRVEALVGYDRIGAGSSTDTDGDDSADGAAYGVGVGYDFDLGGVVAGVEGEFMESGVKEDSTETINGLPLAGRVSVGRDLYVGGRLGFKAAPETLVYAKAGYTNTAIESRFDYDDARYEFDTNTDGFRVGAGVEQKLGSNAFAKVEYRYSNYDKLDFSDDQDENFQTDVDLDRHQVVAGIGYRF